MARNVRVNVVNSSFFLQLTVAAFFLLLGIYGVVPDINEGVFSLWDKNRALEIVFGIIELCSSLVLIAGLVVYTRQKTLQLASLSILIFWSARIVISKFVFGITIVRGNPYFTNGFPNWILMLTVELIILVAIFIINRRYSNDF
ncbi:hypothetical protein KKA14_20205 [bacterium]|nr:hypothetical protein [bacterium]